MSTGSEILRTLDRELWIVTASDGGRRSGLVSTTVVSASIVPESPRVLLTLGHQHFTTSLVRQSRHFALHLMGIDHAGLAFRFGAQSGRDMDKFAGLAIERGRSGVPLLVDAVARLECRVEADFDIGDRLLCLAEVTADSRRSSEPVLTVQQWMARATDAERAALRQNLESDARADAEAIANWRATRV